MIWVFAAFEGVAHQQIQSKEDILAILEKWDNLNLLIRHLPSIMNLAGAVDGMLHGMNISPDFRTKIYECICPWKNKDVPLLSHTPQQYFHNLTTQIFDICRNSWCQEYLFEAIMHVLENSIEKYAHLQADITHDMISLFDALPVDENTIYRCSKLLRAEQTLHTLMDKPWYTYTTYVIDNEIRLYERIGLDNTDPSHIHSYTYQRDATFDERRIDREKSTPPRLLLAKLKWSKWANTYFTWQTEKDKRKYHERPFAGSEHFRTLYSRSWDMLWRLNRYTVSGGLSINVWHQKIFETAAANHVAWASYELWLDTYVTLHEKYPIQNGAATIFTEDPETNKLTLAAYNTTIVNLDTTKNGQDYPNKKVISA